MGHAAQGRVSLWNTHDPALAELQRLSVAFGWRVAVTNAAFVTAYFVLQGCPW